MASPRRPDRSRIPLPARIKRMDARVASRINARTTGAVSDDFWRGLTLAANHGKLWFAAAAVLLALGRPRAAFRGLASLGLASLVANLVGKRLVGGDRPALTSIPLARRLERTPDIAVVPVRPHGKRRRVRDRCRAGVPAAGAALAPARGRSRLLAAAHRGPLALRRRRRRSHRSRRRPGAQGGRPRRRSCGPPRNHRRRGSSTSPRPRRAMECSSSSTPVRVAGLGRPSPGPLLPSVCRRRTSTSWATGTTSPRWSHGGSRRPRTRPACSACTAGTDRRRGSAAGAEGGTAAPRVPRRNVQPLREGRAARLLDAALDALPSGADGRSTWPTSASPTRRARGPEHRVRRHLPVLRRGAREARERWANRSRPDRGDPRRPARESAPRGDRRRGRARLVGLRRRRPLLPGRGGADRAPAARRRLLDVRILFADGRPRTRGAVALAFGGRTDALVARAAVPAGAAGAGGADRRGDHDRGRGEDPGYAHDGEASTETPGEPKKLTIRVRPAAVKVYRRGREAAAARASRRRGHLRGQRDGCGRADVAGRRPDDLAVGGLLQDVRHQPTTRADGERRGEHLARDAAQLHHHARVELDVGVQLASRLQLGEQLAPAARPATAKSTRRRRSPARRRAASRDRGSSVRYTRVAEAHDRPPSTSVARTHSSVRSGVPISSSVSSARLGAPPCSGPGQRAERAARTAAARSAPVEAITRAVKVDALKPWSIVGDQVVARCARSCLRGGTRPVTRYR